MADTIENVQEETSVLDILRVIYKRLYILIIAVIICTLCGVGYIVAKDKPVYTAKKSVMLVANITEGTSSTDDPSNDAKLAKMLLSVVSSHISSPKFIGYANEIYQEEDGGVNYQNYGKITSGGVSVSYKDDSLIFTISYKDVSSAAASGKLDAVIKSANDNLDGNIMANDPKIIEMQTTPTISSSRNAVKYVILSVLLGIVLGVAIILIINACDNRIKDKEELEKITGANFLAYIDDDVFDEKTLSPDNNK